MFAFDQSGKYLDSTNLTGYNDIRKWLTVPADSTGPNRLYVGVGANDNTGAILKWTPASATDYFDFTVVGTTPSDVAELAAASDRIFAGTWPPTSFSGLGSEPPPPEAGLFQSPVSTNGTPDGGLVSAVPAAAAPGPAWTLLWQADNYEPDTVTAHTYGNAVFHGATTVDGSRIVSGVSTPDSGGYWLVSDDGHVYAFGDAPRTTSAGYLGAPIAGMDATPSGKGFVLAGRDGGVFNYGDSTFMGSAAGLSLAAPIVGIAAR